MSNNQGFISLHRKLMNNPIWSDPNYLKLWIYCLFEASHKDRDQLIGNQVVKIERGQFITGRFALEEEMNKGVKASQRLNNQTWWRYLKKLENLKMLNIKSNNKYSVINIVNYDTYQNSFNKNDHQTEQQMNNKRTTDEQQMNTNNNVNNYINNTTTTTGPKNGFGKLLFDFEQNLCKLSPVQIEDLGMWYDDFKQKDEIVLEAIKIAADRDRKNFGFVQYLFREWSNKKLETIDQIKSFERNKFNSKAKPYNNRQPTQHEVIPDWFKKQKEQKKEQKLEDPEKHDEQEMAEMQALLQKHASGGGNVDR